MLLAPFLKSFSESLQAWNRDVFHNIFKMKRQLLARIAGIQRRLSECKDRGLIKLEAKFRRDLDITLEWEEMLWYQKSRVNWIKDGDRNTTFFHLSTIARRWRNKIAAIKDEEGNWIEDKEAVKDHVLSYFTNLFRDDQELIDSELPINIFPEFPLSIWENLTRPFTRCEIEMVVMSMGSMKASGSDGFQALFYQKNWKTVADSVYEMALLSLDRKGLQPSLNETFIVLIPKIDNPVLAKQFRPLSLYNVTYKIITKAIVNRIKPVLPNLISHSQSSFIPGRQITDNIVIVQEALHIMRKKQGDVGYMAIKIDFEKAYDRLKWSFIKETLGEMNFPLLLTDVIMECVSTTSMRVLWNDEPTQSFTPSRGIRQGDPLSPYLFVMCMERLNQVIEEAILANRWKPIRASRNGPKISNVFFADDIILFAEASTD